VDLAYFARVKDARTGRPIRVVPYVSIVDPVTGVYIPFQGDGPGHFRSPDVGAAIMEVSSPPIDTKQLEITITASGYQTLKVASIPRQSKGMVELAVRMVPKANAGQPGVDSVGCGEESVSGEGQRQRANRLVKADDLSARDVLRPCRYFRGGAYSSPPRLQRALTPRSMAIGSICQGCARRLHHNCRRLR
jgi:hypothetical protein